METHVEAGGKTLTGRETREWCVGMSSNVNGRKCEIVRFGKRNSARVLVRWLENPPLNDRFRSSKDSTHTADRQPYVNTGRTQWVGMYQIEPAISV